MGPDSCRNLVASVGALALVVGTRAEARASGGAATDSYEDIGNSVVDLHALVDLDIQHAFNASPSGVTLLRAFDTRTGEPRVGTFRVTLAHKPGIFGFRLDVGVGDIADGYLRYDPAAFDHPGLSRGLSYVEQAFVTATVPVGRGLIVDVGRFGTPVGLEDNEALGNWNYSRSLLYLLAEPSYHAGLRLTYPFGENVAVSLFWVNGWNATLFDGNGMRAFATAVSWRPTTRLEIVLDYIGGLERAPTHLADPRLSTRSVLDAYARLELIDRVSVACTGDYGRDATNGGASWWGIGGYARVRVLDWLGGAVRAERYDDGDGFTTGVRQRLAELTATAEVRGTLDPVKWMARLEYRRDQSDTTFFATSAPRPSTHQDTLGASLLAAF